MAEIEINTALLIATNHRVSIRKYDIAIMMTPFS